jgi:sugar phosphate isomerase/epimerase
MTKARITRRNFLQSSSMTGTALLCGSVYECALAANGSGYQIGCYTRPFDEFDWKTAFDKIAEAGFKFVGLMTTNTKDWTMVHPSTSRDVVLEYREHAANRGLDVISLYGDFSPTADASENVKSLQLLIDYCSICDCPHLLLGGISDERLYTSYYQAIKECCAYASERRVRMSIKPHGGQNATGPQCRKIVERVGHQTFGLWYDPGNIFYYSDGKVDPVQDSATVNGLVLGMSIKDFQPPKEVLVNPGDGQVDFASVMKTLRGGGFTSGPLVLECLKRGSLDEVTASARRARQFIERLSQTQA